MAKNIRVSLPSFLHGQNFAGIVQFLGSAQLNWQESCRNSRGDQKFFRRISGRAPNNFMYQTFV
jgi:hypothetical protein